MVERWSTRTGLYAILAALAIIAAGCSHVATVPEADDPDQIDQQQADEDSVATVELDPAVTKLDEAEIGVSGPEQIEEAIETLDAQTESSPPLVSGIGGTVAAPSSGDLFERIRTGFLIEDVDHATVEREVKWYASHPTYLDRTFKRGERYLYHIVNEIEARKMPLELALLPVVESAFNPVAYSRARASGLWQFIPGTGRRYDLKQNWYYDGRRDVVAATTAALDYLQFLSEEFDGDWLLAIAAYNCGEANISRAVARNRKAGKPTDFFSLKLPRETRAYVPKLLAMRRIVNDPATHGLEFAPIPNEPYFAQIDVAGQIDLHVAAELAELAPEELLALNPAFNHWVTDPDGPYQLLVPVDRQTRFAEAVAALPPEKRVRVVYHHVKKGDTLGGIADKYGVSVAAIKTSNKIRGTMIRPGQDLLITAAPTGMGSASPTTLVAAREPRNSSDKHIVRRGDTLWSISRSHGVTMESIVSSNGLSSDDTLAVGQVLQIPGTATLASTQADAVETRSTTYVVRRGDTLSHIATKFRVRLSDLLGWNDLNSRSVIKPGQQLVMYVGDDQRAGI
ncbi:MAG TPA: LysM peptidoglycan-binding domain-containing protein [Steroidobacteraceae bacterium]|jgi:membrane-bound lytic murein transglycosylase D|nr:LysM peptidoglycan-binding domain-containing protein [Steroidobacteraceae bacterium]